MLIEPSQGCSTGVQRKQVQKSPNFKALVIEPNIKQNVRQVYHQIIDNLSGLKEKLAGYKFWDLKVVASASAPLLLLRNKENGTTYNAIPERVYEPTDFYGKFAGKAFIPCEMFLPPNKNGNFPNVQNVSPIDKDNGNNRHLANIIYDSPADAQNAFQELSILQYKYYNLYYNGGRLNEDYLNYPLYLLEEFEKSSTKKEELEPDSKTQLKPSEPKKTYIVKKGNIEFIELKKDKEVKQTPKNTGFARVAGMNDLKETLKEDVILPLQQIELYKKYGIAPANGVLLYGPPGTGKTFIAEALAEESGRTFLRMDVAETESKWVGETAKNIANIFKEAEENAPSIIFIDEMEALAPSRSNLSGSSSVAIGYNQSVNTLLQNMNNCGERGIFVIAASNEPQKIDSAIKRAGRIDKNIFVPPPDFEARKEIFRMTLEDIYAEENINYDNLAKLTENYTAPEIKQIIIRQASLKALKQNRKVSESDILELINQYKPQLNVGTIAAYRAKGQINKDSELMPRIGFTK